MWQLNLYGDVALRDPSGRSVGIPYRHVILVLVALIQYRESGISREDLAAVAWPETPSWKRRTSLRQAIAVLRRLVGSEYLITTSATCRLAPSFQIRTDLEDPALRTSSQINAAFDLDWVTGLEEPLHRALPAAATPSDSFFSLVAFTTKVDPARALGLMRENVSLCHSLSHEQLVTLVLGLGHSEALPGWRQYFQGYVLRERGDVFRANRMFQAAREAAQVDNDIELSVQCGVQLTLAEIWSGSMSLAHSYADSTISMAMRSSNRNHRASAAQVKGCALLHSGQAELAGQFYAKAVQSYTNTLDAHTINAVHQYYAALLKQPAVGELPDDQTVKLAEESGHRMMLWFAYAARLLLRMPDTRPYDILPALTDSTRLADQIGNDYYSIFARECLARALWRAGEEKEAKATISENARLRTRHSLSNCIWDQVAL